MSIGNNVIPTQLVEMTIKAILAPNLNFVNAFSSACGYNDTHVRDYANPVELLWEFTVCQGAPRHLLQLAEKISSVFLWATRHRVGFIHGTTCDQDEREA